MNSSYIMTSDAGRSPRPVGWPHCESGSESVDESVDFFRHHGVWAPGVRLFRRIRFTAKAVLICAVFLVPITSLGWSYFSSNADSIAFSAKERLGVEYAREVMPLLALAHQRRGQSGDTAALREKTEAQMKKLAAVEARLGAELGTGKNFSSLTHALAALGGIGGTGDAVYAAHTRYIDGLLALLGQSTDGSNLTLDPDIDSYYVMDAALFRNPQMIELADRLRAAGAAVLAGGSAKPEFPELMATLNDAAPVYAYHLDNLDVGLAKAVVFHPGLEATLQSREAIAKSKAFIGLVRSSLRAAQGSTGDSGAYVASAETVIALQHELSGHLFDALDGLIVARIDGMKAQRNLSIAIVVVALALGIYLFCSFFLVTHGGLLEVQRHLEAITAGDLTTHPRPWGNDEAAALMGSLADMQKSLRGIVTRVRGSSESIVHASSEIASASMDLSSRTEQTAANLEQSASSMEQISSTVKNTAENSAQASAVATGNAKVAARGGQVIAEVVATMQEINTSSNKINEIIGVIDGIAFQTNILALNAAVEAARAGEQGRGFAVVAAEVRSLAQRSAQAAKEIKTLITASVEKVESGARVVQGAGQTMEELVAHAERMRHLLAEISTAAAEQSSGVTQVGTAVQDLDKMTQQNAALVEQTAAAAAALRDQAVDLAGEVARFKLPAS